MSGEKSRSGHPSGQYNNVDMTKLLAGVALLFSTAYNTRLTLKKLKVLTSEEFMSNGPSEDDAKKEFLAECQQILKYWTCTGLLVLFDFYFEFMIRWFPGYFYIKAAVILAITFPRLRISTVMFDRGIVPFLRESSKKIESHGGLINMVFLLLYSAPFLVVDIIFPAKLQFTQFIKKSFRIGHTDSDHQPSVYDIIDTDNHLVDAVDYFVPSPVLSPGGETVEERDSIQGSSRMSTSGRPSVGFVSSTSPFRFSDDDDEEENSGGVDREVDEYAPSPLASGQKYTNDTSRRLSSFNDSCMKLNEEKSHILKSSAPSYDWRRASVAVGEHAAKRPHYGDALGLGALLDINILSPPITSSQRKLRRETLSTCVYSGKSKMEKIKTSPGTASAGPLRSLPTSPPRSGMKLTSLSSKQVAIEEPENSINQKNVVELDNSPKPETVSLSRRRKSGSRRRSIM